jgi:hypothetical protein
MTELAHPAGDVAPTGARRHKSESAGQRLRRMAKSVVGHDLYASARSVYWLARGEELRTPFPLRHKINAWRRGFFADSAIVYDLGRNDPRDYVSDDMRRRCSRINPIPNFFRNKLAFRSVLLTRGFPQPDTVAFLAGGNIVLNPLGQPAVGPSRYVDAEELERLLIAEGGQFIFKPEDGHRGQGIFVAEVRDGALIRRRGTAARPFRVAEVAGATMLVERRIEQADFWRELFPQVANTIRAVTMWVPGEAEPFLGAAAQRIGNTDTVPTDNWSGGGICSRIDLSTGQLGVGLTHPRMGRGGVRHQEGYTHHPDSGAQIEGAVIPGWSAIKDTVLRAAASLPTNRIVGWDVLVDRTGTPIILEGNGNGGLRVVQSDGGMLADPKVRRFYVRCGVL